MSGYVEDLMAQVRATSSELSSTGRPRSRRVSLARVRTPLGIPRAKILERIIEPERIIMFRVPGSTTGRGARQPGYRMR